MEWVIGTFGYMRALWEVRVKKMGSEKPGHRAYAARETDRWDKWTGIAKMEFAKVTGMKQFQI
jgi:hypothetical protein